MISDFADRGANTVRLGTYWGGLAMFPSEVSPRVSALKPGVDPLAEAMATVRARGMHLMAYINPNAYRKQNPFYGTNSIRKSDGDIWDVKAYGIKDTHYACSNHPAFADFYRKAIAELFATYDVDGIYIDGLSPHVCYCEHCRKKFARDTGRALPAGLESLGPLSVLWEMTSDWQPVGDPANPEHQLYSRWLMKCLADVTRLFAEEARRAKPTAVVVFHTWPKPDSVRWYAGTLNEIYARKPWRYTLWKRAEFSNWGDAFSVPSLVNIYLRQHAWGSERRKITSETEARHLYWQALANGAYPNAWAHLGMDQPFELMRSRPDLFDFPNTLPTRFLALPRPFFLSARHKAVVRNTGIPLRPGAGNRLRIWEREPTGRIDLLCLRADGKAPADDEFTKGRVGVGQVVYLKAAEFVRGRSVLTSGDRSWQIREDPDALSGSHLTSSGHSLEKAPRLPLEYDLPELTPTGPWMLWARVIFPNTGADSFYWQVSSDSGKSWHPGKPTDSCAVGWEQPLEYAWVQARVAPLGGRGERSARFMSPPSGIYAGLLHAGLPVKLMHSNHLNPQSLSGFSVLVLANEVCMSDAQCEAVRSFVRRGGGLVASHETSLYDETGRRRPNFGLRDVLGVDVRRRTQPPEGARLVLTDGPPLDIPDRGLPVHEEVVEVVPRDTATIAASIGVLGGERALPGAILNTLGRGRVVYFPGRQDGEYAFHEGSLGHFPGLIRSAVQHLAPANSIPACIAESPAPVGLTCFDQPSRNRRILHLVAYNADWTGAYDALPPIPNIRICIGVHEGQHLADIRAVRAGQTLVANPDGSGNVTVTLPVLNEYEVLVLEWR